MRESAIQNNIRLALSEYGIVFRTNAGKFWQGKRVYSKEFNQYVLINLRPVTGLPEGFSDTLYIGNNDIAFIEVKTSTGKVREEQKRFLNTMRQYGHKAGIARSVEDAISIIHGRQYD